MRGTEWFRWRCERSRRARRSPAVRSADVGGHGPVRAPRSRSPHRPRSGAPVLRGTRRPFVVPPVPRSAALDPGTRPDHACHHDASPSRRDAGMDGRARHRGR